MRTLLACLALLFTLHSAGAASPGKIYTFNAEPLNQLDLRETTNANRLWDTMHVLASLQGLANRNQARFYIFYCHEFGVATDRFWLDWLGKEDDWLRGTAIVNLPDFRAVVEQFRNSCAGLVAYDPQVPASALAASTAAGCDRLLPVRFDPAPDSVFTMLTRTYRLPVKLWLVQPDGGPFFTGKGVIPGTARPSSGSPKADAHLWALERYGKRAAPCLAHYIDSFWLQHPRRAGPEMHTLSNHDWFVARKAFFFDLSPWGDEPPNDDPAQRLGLDKETLMKVLHAAYDRARGQMVPVGGFPPWPFKYTDQARPPGRHEAVPTEWEFGRILSQYNAYMEADAAGLGGMANASFFQHYPLKKVYRQNAPRPTPADWARQGFVDEKGRVKPHLYLGHYVGDYDSPSWLYKAVPRFFNDPKRGAVPLAWAFNPNLTVRAPQAMVYAYRHATTNDFFVAGDSGAGYLNPRSLTIRPDSKLPSGLRAWERHCREHYRRWDLSITGFILDGSGGASTELEYAAYLGFSPDGAGTHFEKGPSIRAGIPTCPERDLPDNVLKAAELIAHSGRELKGQPGFFWARSILKSPTWYAELEALLAEKYPNAQVRTVDPYTFFGLIRAVETAK